MQYQMSSVPADEGHEEVEQLAAMVTHRCTTKESLQAIDGLGEMKIKKYGAKLSAEAARRP